MYQCICLFLITEADFFHYRNLTRGTTICTLVFVYFLLLKLTSITEIKCSVGNIPNGHVLENGVLTDGFVTWGNNITYSCIDGYILVDIDTKGILQSSASARSCGGKGVLSGKEPHCARMYNM